MGALRRARHTHRSLALDELSVNTLDKDLLAEEQLFLAEKVYRGASRHELVRIDYSNRFSDRV